jgi:hypothetical protein
LYRGDWAFQRERKRMAMEDSKGLNRTREMKSCKKWGGLGICKSIWD